MVELSKEQLIEVISSLSVIELSELVKALEKKFGVSAAQPIVAAVSPQVAGVDIKTEEKTEFDVLLASVGVSKINVIKLVREITGLGLKESKDLVDNAPKTIKEKVSKSEADDIKKKFSEIGANVELK
ncbi:MAG: 50S ribosomal protein L7/L12 [Endomicrobium sp.]|jgi:large subunit ribosomal protein L7/L12|nr:50S ribosomal protein L7/L12 [Endomicrobium sp.]